MTVKASRTRRLRTDRLFRSPLRLCVSAVAILLASAGCKPTDATDPVPVPSGTSASTAPATVPASARTATDREDALPVPTEELAAALAASELSWSRAEAILKNYGLVELDEHPVDMPIARRASIVLPGYGTVKLPKGVGVDATTVERNEGQADVTLYGGKSVVQEFGVSKSYPESDMRAFVGRVLPGFTIDGQAAACPGTSVTEHAAQVFRVHRNTTGRPLHVVVQIDDTVKYGPPTTQLDVYTREPTPFDVGCPITDDQGGA